MHSQFIQPKLFLGFKNDPGVVQGVLLLHPDGILAIQLLARSPQEVVSTLLMPLDSLKHWESGVDFNLVSRFFSNLKKIVEEKAMGTRLVWT